MHSHVICVRTSEKQITDYCVCRRICTSVCTLYASMCVCIYIYAAVSCVFLSTFRAVYHEAGFVSGIRAGKKQMCLTAEVGAARPPSMITRTRRMHTWTTGPRNDSGFRIQHFAFLNTDVHTCLHAYKHAYIIHTYIHTYVHTYTSTSRHTAAHCTYVHTYIHTYLRTYVRTYVRT